MEIIDRSRTLEVGPEGQLIRGGSYFTSYFFRNREQNAGWLFDDKIVEPWQLSAHHAPQSDLVIVGGMGSSKTLGIAMSAVTHCATTPDFKFLNVAPVSWQSKQMYDEIIRWAGGTLFEERLLWKAVTKPYPQLTIKYRYYNEAGRIVTHTSSLEFMSTDENGKKILTWSGDWVNIDQGESVPDISEALVNLGTRVRGSVKGREVMGRLSITANSAENPELWWLLDQAKVSPETSLSFLISTYNNKNLTPKQIKAFERRLGNDPVKIAQHMRAERPIGGGHEFSSSLVAGCVNEGLDQIMESALKVSRPGFFHGDMERAGCTWWAMPPEKLRVYFIVGDPGQGKPPYRNAPCIMVFDTTEYPEKPATLRAFWWGDGGGMYSPFIDQYVFLFKLYNCVVGGYDSTAGQKVHSELSFPQSLNIVPIDMSGVKKNSFMVTLKLMMAKGRVNFPRNIKGIIHQFAQYVLPDTKIAQDIVSTFFVLAGLFWYMGFEVSDLPDENDDQSKAPPVPSRYSRRDSDRYHRQIVRA